MRNPTDLLSMPPDPTKRWVRCKSGIKGFFEQNRYVTPADPPFQVSDRRAAELIKDGLAIPVSEPMERAVQPQPAEAERAVRKRP